MTRSCFILSSELFLQLSKCDVIKYSFLPEKVTLIRNHRVKKEMDVCINKVYNETHHLEI